MEPLRQQHRPPGRAAHDHQKPSTRAHQGGSRLKEEGLLPSREHDDAQPPLLARPAHGLADAECQGLGHDPPLSTEGARGGPAAPGLRIIIIRLRAVGASNEEVCHFPESKKILKLIELQEWRQDTTTARLHGPDHLRRERKGGIPDRPKRDRRDSIKQGAWPTQAHSHDNFEM